MDQFSIFFPGTVFLFLIPLFSGESRLNS